MVEGFDWGELDEDAVPPTMRPGDMVQDDDGGIYVSCADGLMRLVDANEEPYTPAELDRERGPLIPIEARPAKESGRSRLDRWRGRRRST